MGIYGGPYEDIIIAINAGLQLAIVMVSYGDPLRLIDRYILRSLPIKYYWQFRGQYQAIVIAMSGGL
jgi:hypothetical protein